MEFRLLGPLEVYEGAQPLRLGGRKQRAVLALLALSAGRTLSTERLVDELWGDDVPDTAVKMVQIYVSQLRKALPAPVIHTRGSGYVLDVEPESVDVQRFERLAGEGRALLARGERARAAAVLAEGLDLWRGPALAEFASEPFGRVEIARLQELQLAALEDRLEAELELGRHADVVGELEALVARQPLRERPRRLQLLALYRSGRHADALAAYQSYRRTLDEDLGIEPSPALRELERAILRQDPALEAVPEPSPPAPAAPLPAPAPPAGREDELAQLRAELEAAVSGRRRLVLVTGDAGIGKSTLVEAVVAEAEARQPLLVGRGLCLEQHGGGEPYLPVLDALGGLCEGPFADGVVPVLLRRAPTWMAQMPWFVDPAALDELHRQALGATRERMLRELGEAVDAVAALRPLVLVLEDLHWADPATLDAVAWIVRRSARAPVLLIGTYVPGSSAAEAIAELSRELHARRRCVEVPLESLGRDALAELAARRVGAGELADRLGAVLHERTGGNPLFAESVLDGWLEEGALVQIQGAWRPARSIEELSTAVPDGIRSFVLSQLSRLEEGEQLVLEAAAVAGAEAAVPAVAAAVELPEDDVELACEQLARRRRFLERRDPAEWPDGTIAGRYGFVHQVHQQVLYEHIPDARRALLHRRVAERLELAYGAEAGEIAAELASHYERGRVPERAVVSLRLAAEQSLRRLAPRLAIGQLQAALATLPALPEGVERERLELDLLSLLGQALVVADGWTSAEAEAALVRARDLAHLLSDNEPMVPVLVALGTIYEARGEYERAEETARECLQAIPEYDDAHRLQAHEVLACSLFHQGSFSRALEHAELGAALSEAQLGEEPGTVVLGDDVGVACHDWAALALWFLGYPERAVARAWEAVHLAEDPRRVYGLAAANVQAAIVHQCRDEPLQARECAERARDLSDRHGYAYRAGLATALRGWARAASGEADGIAELERGVEAVHATGIRMDDAYLSALLADALLRAGAPGGAARVLAAALEDRRTPSFVEAELLRLRGVLAASTGEAGAEEWLRSALDTARSQGARSLELRCAVSLGRLLADDGRGPEALVLVTSALAALTEGLEGADGTAARALAAELESGPAGAAAPRDASRAVLHASSGGVRIAYQLTGLGTPDIVLVPEFASHLECDWQEPLYAGFLDRLGAIGRLIRFDKRGTGLSDREAEVPDLETRIDDLRAVMDAAGSERAVVFGDGEGVSTAILFAATHPDRVRSLILYGGFAKRIDPDDDYPWAPTAEERRAYIERVVGPGGYEWDLRQASPSAGESLTRWWADRYRAAMTPEAARRLMEMNSRIDVRGVLGAIHVPTLVIHRGGRYVAADEGRYVARGIAAARFVGLAGDDHFVAIDHDAILDVVEPFVLDASAEAPAGEDGGRVLATILVTDIVGSTEVVGRLGDRAWAELLEQHRRVVRNELGRFSGREVDSAGDGFLAAFDGPGRAIRCGLALRERLAPLGLSVRAGVHTGEVERRGRTLSGIAIHLTSRVAEEAAAGEVLVTATTRDLVSGAGFEFDDRGERSLRGLGEPRRLYAVRQ
ncbi:MAG TPA: BTAD domain-containing putative transcriptional regulator [Gaiellaceae bacterium]|jgi:DNA-binding SARP family transcriptional activator/class 3 adenylate cyclase